MKDPFKFHFILLYAMLVTGLITVGYLFVKFITLKITFDDLIWGVVIACILYFLLGWIKSRERKFIYKNFIDPEDKPNGE